MIDDVGAIPLYIFLELWYILVAASAGPVAVAVGEHVSHSRAVANGSPSTITFEVGLVVTTFISLFGTVKRIWRPKFPSAPKWMDKLSSRQRVMVSNREQTVSTWTANSSSYASKRSRWRIEAPDFICGSVLLSSLVVLLIILLIFATFLAVYLGFGVAIAALTTQLLFGEVPIWVLISAVPTALHFNLGLIRTCIVCRSHNDLYTCTDDLI
ncbi:hypothetical protein FB567DRAFT_173957 [Paraphoma chrysanthemicola]|uniref:Transmembrane protein n=1 Tax=Paraphoma chrysanthemicola TaxID=798071 RepID=A0A8K0RFH3_9PLEO|nr:hypothetical protein FB567DRAFT_173957 [Paraphoma chrysanthemicola]